MQEEFHTCEYISPRMWLVTTKDNKSGMRMLTYTRKIDGMREIHRWLPKLRTIIENNHRFNDDFVDYVILSSLDVVSSKPVFLEPLPWKFAILDIKYVTRKIIIFHKRKKHGVFFTASGHGPYRIETPTRVSGKTRIGVTYQALRIAYCRDGHGILGGSKWRVIGVTYRCN